MAKKKSFPWVKCLVYSAVAAVYIGKTDSQRLKKNIKVTLTMLKVLIKETHKKIKL